MAGDSYYNQSVQELKHRKRFEDPMLTVDELKRSVEVEGYAIKLDIDDCVINGLITAKNSEETPNLKKGLMSFYEDFDWAVVTTRGISVAAFRYKEIFYYYDSHSRDEKGLTRSKS